MNIAQIQSSSVQVQQNSLSHSGESNGLFGNILSTNVAALQTTTTKPNQAENMVTINSNTLTSILAFLNIGSVSELEQGEQLTEEMLYTTIPLEENPLLKELIGLEEGQSLEQMMSSLLSGMSDEENVVSEDLLQQMEQLLAGFNREDIYTVMRNPSIESVLKLSKLYTLMKNYMDLSEGQVQKIEQMEQSIDKLTGRLQELLQSIEKSSKNAAALFLNRQAYLDQLQSFQSQDAVRGSQSKSLGMNNGLGNVPKVEQYTVDTKHSEKTSLHNPFINMSKVEQYVLNTQNIKTNSDSNSLVKSFENILSKAQFSNQNGIQKLLIKLNPEHLGSLRVELVQREGAMIARIIASSHGAKELLDGQLQGLKQAFIQQNIPVEKIELSQQFTNLSQESHLKREQFQQQHGNENAEQATDNEEFVDEDFQNTFEEAILQAKV